MRRRTTQIKTPPDTQAGVFLQPMYDGLAVRILLGLASNLTEAKVSQVKFRHKLISEKIFQENSIVTA